MKRGTIVCPVDGSTAFRKETRRLLSPKTPRVQLYVCAHEQHQIECILYIMHVDVKGAPKKYLNRHSTKGAAAQAGAALEDYDD